MSVSRLLSRPFTVLRYLSPALIAVMLATAVPTAAYAQTYTWTGGGWGAPNTWSASGNWTEGTPQSGFNTQIVFGPTTFDKKIANNDISDLVLNVLRFTDFGYTISGNSLTFAGVAPQLVNAVGGTTTVNNGLNFGSTGLTINTQVQGSSLLLNGKLTGTGDLTKMGIGGVVLTSTNNTATGAIHVNQGGLYLRQGGKLTSGTVSLGTLASSGFAGVQGNGSQWDVDGNLNIGANTIPDGPGGGMFIQYGGVMNVTGETRLVGQGSIIADGGTLSTNTLTGRSGIRIGSSTLSDVNSFTLIQSGDSLFNGGILGTGERNFFAKKGAGTLNIAIGGTLDGSLLVHEGGLSFVRFTNDIGYVGYNSAIPATVTVTGNDGYWNNTRTNIPYTSTQVTSLFVGNNGTGTLNITDADLTSNLARIGMAGGTGTVNISGVSSEWINTGANLYFGMDSGSSGTLNLSNGAKMTSATTYLGSATNSIGSVTLSGANTRWDAGQLYIGNAGTGILNVNSGAFIAPLSAFIGIEPGSIGTVVVEGAGTIWSGGGIKVGARGQGSLAIRDGAYVWVSGTTVGGAGNVATMTVDGVGTRVLAGKLDVGALGWTYPGTKLDITGGAALEASATDIGANAAINVAGTGSKLTTFGTLNVNRLSNLNITNGGYLDNRASVLIANTGKLLVSGAGSQWNTTYLVEVGKDDYTGSTVSIENGAVASVGALSVSGNSIVNVDGPGSTLATPNSLVIGAGNTFFMVPTVSTATMNITNGARVNSYGVSIGRYSSSSTLVNQGIVNVDGTGSLWNIARFLTVGGGDIGTLNITNGGTVTSVEKLVGMNASAGNAGTVNVIGAGSEWNSQTNAVSPMTVGQLSPGFLNILGGGIVRNNDVVIASSFNVNGVATVDGVGSQWLGHRVNGSEVPDTITIGKEGTGILTITNGGFVSKGITLLAERLGANGILNIDGDGSLMTTNELLLGEGNATISLTNNGRLIVNGEARLTGGGGSNLRASGGGSNLSAGGGGNRLSASGGYMGVGTLTGNSMVALGGGGLRLDQSGNSTYAGQFIDAGDVSGGSFTKLGTGNLSLTNSTNFIGGTLRVEEGALSIINGGQFRNSRGFIYGATVNVSGAGSLWNNRGSIEMGGDNAPVRASRLSITGGGIVEATSGLLAAATNAATEIRIDGAGSRLNLANDFTMGGATLSITSGGRMDSAAATILGAPSKPSTITIDGVGSQWNSKSGMFLLRLNANANITNGGVLNSAASYISTDSAVKVSGTGSQWNNSVLLSIGNTRNSVLNIAGGGAVSVNGETRLFAPGTIEANGGTLNTTTLIDSGASNAGVIQVTGAGLLLNQSGDSTFNGVIRDGAAPGTFTKAGAGALTLTANSTHRTTAVSAGTLNLAGSGVLAGNVNVTGGTFANSGTVNGLTTITGGVAKGNGNFAGGYIVQNGGALQLSSTPGILRSGSATWNDGGSLLFSIDSAAGVAGTNWGLNQITGNLSLASSNIPFTIVLQSLLPGTETSGMLAGFDPTKDYTWNIVQATTGITGLDTARFRFDVGAFAPYNPGVSADQFSLSQLGDTLNLKYSRIVVVVPETGTGLLALLGGVVSLAGIVRRRRK